MPSDSSQPPERCASSGTAPGDHSPRTYSYTDLISAFLQWLPFRQAEDSELRRYHENRWRAYSAAFGMTLTDADSATHRIQARVSMPHIFFDLLHHTAEIFCKTSSPFGYGLEAPEDFHRIVQRYGPKLSATTTRHQHQLQNLMCHLVRKLYGRQRRIVTDVELKAYGIDAVPYPASDEWD